MSHEFYAEKIRPLVGINENLFLANPITGSSDPTEEGKIAGFFARVLNLIERIETPFCPDTQITT